MAEPIIITFCPEEELLKQQSALQLTASAERRRQQRQQVNYLRHCYTNYDQLLERYTGVKNGYKSRKLIRKTLLTALAELYPSLAEECLRQRGKPAQADWPVVIKNRGTRPRFQT